MCEECGKGFKAKSVLEKHMVVHKKERDFVCHICGVDYPAQDTLLKHIRKYHSEASTKLKEEDGGQVFSCKYCELTSPFKVVIHRHQLTHKKELGNQCQLCEKCYTSDAGLKRHMRINHPVDEQPAECPYCKKPFKNKDYMNTHMKKNCQLKKAAEEMGAATGQMPTAPEPVPPPPSRIEFLTE